MINKEIERRWLLKNVPDLPWDTVTYIEQYYILLEGGTLRVRASFDPSSRELISIESIIKRSVSFGENSEEQVDISHEEAIKLVEKAGRIMAKVRHVYCYKNLKFEVDAPQLVRIIMLEVELDSLDQIVEFPQEIEAEIIMEITGIREFSNYALAASLEAEN